MPKPQSPTFADILAQFGENLLAGVWTALPGRVQSYDAATQRAEVCPTVKNVFYDENDDRQVENLPVISATVIFPGSGADRTTYPIEAGDLGVLVFASCSLDRFSVGDGRDVDPGEERRNHLSDAWFFPGAFAKTPPTSAPIDAVVVHATQTLKLGGPSASEGVTRGSDVEEALKGALKDSGIAAAILASGGPGGQVALEAAVDLYFSTNHVEGSSVVKAVD